MKISKNTAIAYAVSIMLSGIIVIFLGCFASQMAGYNTIQNIVLGIFSSSIVSFIISFVGYFHERSSIIEKTENNIKSLLRSFQNNRRYVTTNTYGIGYVNSFIWKYFRIVNTEC